MPHSLARLDALRRPPLLIRAARIGLCAYRREVHLRRHLGPGPLPGGAQVLARLIEIEAALEAARQERAADYSAARHVDVMIAMMEEARLLRAGFGVPALLPAS